MFTEQWKPWVTISLGFFVGVVIPIGAFLAVMYVMVFASMVSQPHTRGARPQMPLGMILFIYLGLLALIIVLMPLSVFMMGGAYRAAFKQLRGERIQFRDLFSGRDCYWRLLGATVMQFLLVMIGMVLCIIPAFIVAGLLFFTPPLIAERNMGVFEAMRASRDVTRRNWLMFTIFAILVQLIASIGSQACYVGLLVTWPLTFTISAVAFRDCFGVAGARSFSQKASATQAGYEAPPATYAPSFEDGTVACPNCRGPLPPTARFCYHCGTNLSA